MNFHARIALLLWFYHFHKSRELLTNIYIYISIILYMDLLVSEYFEMHPVLYPSRLRLSLTNNGFKTFVLICTGSNWTRRECSLPLGPSGPRAPEFWDVIDHSRHWVYFTWAMNKKHRVQVTTCVLPFRNLDADRWMLKMYFSWCQRTWPSTF